MQKVIISDTSCLILLQNIGELEILHKLFGTITTTKEVAIEFGLPLPDWISINSAQNKKYQSIIESVVDIGEASAIALAVECDESLLIINDLKQGNLQTTWGLISLEQWAYW